MSEDAQNGIVVRKNEDGSLDELFLYARGEVILHLEDLGSNGWWIGCYPPNGDDWHLNFMPGPMCASQQREGGADIKGKDRS